MYPMFMIVLVYLSFVSIDTIDVNLLCLGFHNTREIREVLAIFSRDTTEIVILNECSKAPNLIQLIR